MGRVAPLSAGDDAGPEYEAAGRAARDFIVSWLPGGFSLEGKAVLDFGCGAGRVLRHFAAEAQSAELWGSEIDEASVRWMQASLCPPFRAVLHGEAPPIDLPDRHFDLVYAMSVFTHITEQWSAWLLELHRLLAFDGLLLVTFLGPDMIAPLVGERWSDDRIGINFTRSGTRWDVGGPNTFISPWWLRAHWGRAFDILRVEPAAYDSGDRRGLHGVALLRRREVALSVEALERPEPGEPREWLSARHNVRQLGRELAAVRRDLDRAEEATRAAADRADWAERHWRGVAEWWEDKADAFIQSRPWRLSAPLRRVRNRLRRL